MDVWIKNLDSTPVSYDRTVLVSVISFNLFVFLYSLLYFLKNNVLLFKVELLEKLPTFTNVFGFVLAAIFKYCFMLFSNGLPQ